VKTVTTVKVVHADSANSDGSESGACGQ